MPAPQTPVATPVTFSFDNEEIQLTSKGGSGSIYHTWGWEGGGGLQGLLIFTEVKFFWWLFMIT